MAFKLRFFKSIITTIYLLEVFFIYKEISLRLEINWFFGFSWTRRIHIIILKERILLLLL